MMAHNLSASTAADLLRGKGRILISGCAAEPLCILDAVRTGGDQWRGECLTGAFIPGVNDQDYRLLVPQGRVETIFTTEGLRQETTEEAGSVAHLPMHYTAYWQRLARPGVIAAAVMTVPPPAPDGSIGFGLACDFLPAAITCGVPLIGVVNPAMPDVRNGPRLPRERFLGLVEDDRSLPVLTPATPDATSLAIAARVVGLLRPGATLQLGLGRLQAAILAVLREERPRDLGYHAGMIAPGVLEPGLFPRGITTGVALGPADFNAEVAQSSNIRFAPVGWTHSIATLAALPALFSVNSALAVDLQGQVSAERLGSTQFSGQGGMVDFVRGARASEGGLSVIALPSSARGGTESRILEALAPGAPVSVARADIDIVVTEHGTADLREADLKCRAERLAAIAAPQFRDQLLAAARRL